MHATYMEITLYIGVARELLRPSIEIAPVTVLPLARYRAATRF
jgi:hypothetical protein